MAIAALAGGWYLRGDPDKPAPRGAYNAIPLIDGPQECVTPTARELKRYEQSIEVLDEFGDSINSMRLGAERFLGSGQFRHDGTKSLFVCPPPDLYPRAANIIDKYKMWSKGRLDRYELYLASRTGGKNREIIDAVARVAFAKAAQPDDLPYRDLRPAARTVLAGFGSAAADYTDMAYEQMSADDALGTGAVQIAVATGHPGALPRASELMEEILSSIPKEKTVPRATKYRLYELAYAISFGGAEGQNYMAPILDLMHRKVQSWAPPFGLIDVPPKVMCNVLRIIDAPAPGSVENFAYCLDPKISYDH